jgi:hypothetical protein
MPNKGYFSMEIHTLSWHLGFKLWGLSVWLHSTLLMVKVSFFLSFFSSQRMIALICCRCSPLVNYLYFYTIPKLKNIWSMQNSSHKRGPRSKLFESGWAKLWIYFRLLGFWSLHLKKMMDSVSWSIGKIIWGIYPSTFPCNIIKL